MIWRVAGGIVLCSTLVACGGTSGTTQASGSDAVVVTGADLPYTMADGAAARQAADARCGPRGVRTSIYDRFEAGTWIYPQGCA